MIVVAVTAALAFLIAGAYAAAVLDTVVAGLVAGRPPRWRSALVEPARSAALIALQRPTTTERPDAAAWRLAPALLAALAATMLAPVPLAPTVAVADVPHGVILFGAAAALVVVPVFLQGWSPNSVFALIGAYRMLSQGLSYMIPLALALIAAVLPAESLSIGDIVADQARVWNVVRMPLGLVVYLVAATGLAFYGPLSLPAGADVASGVEMEASSAPLLAWRAAQRAVLVAASAVGASVFLGGWQGPLLPGYAWLALKTTALLIVFVAARHLVPRPRAEAFVIFGWVVLLPLSLLNIFVTGWWLL